jgi:predicted HAD superfamily phosphohydrolase YqeG
LAKENKTYLNAITKTWLENFISTFNAKHIFILSNQSRKIRREYFASMFPFIKFITKVKKKPHTEGIKKVKKKMQCSHKSIMLVDDRVTTGFLCSTIYNSHPVIMIKHYEKEKISLMRSPFKFLERVFFNHI